MGKEYLNFSGVISILKEACNNSGQLVENHIVETNEMVSIGSGAERLNSGQQVADHFEDILEMINIGKTAQRDKQINAMVSQLVIPYISYFGGSKPFKFTEQGIAMPSAVLRTPLIL